MIMRVGSGFIGILMIFGMVISFLGGGSFVHGRHALAMLLMPFAFLLYAFGGQKLIQTFLPMFTSGEEEAKNGKDKEA